MEKPNKKMNNMMRKRPASTIRFPNKMKQTLFKILPACILNNHAEKLESIVSLNDSLKISDNQQVS